jgi:hypothetical protein
MTQQTFMTPEALQFSARRNAELIARNSVMRIAAFAQPVPHKGSWGNIRLNWNDEPERVASFAPVAVPCAFNWSPS